MINIKSLVDFFTFQSDLFMCKLHRCVPNNQKISYMFTFLTFVKNVSSYILQGGHGTGKTGNLVLTFSRQGKHREFCFDTGKNFETQGKYFSMIQGKI